MFEYLISFEDMDKLAGQVISMMKQYETHMITLTLIIIVI